MRRLPDSPSHHRTHPHPRVGVLLSLLTLAPAFAIALQAPSPQPTTTPGSPRDWAVRASDNEIRAINRDGPPLRYTMHTTDAKGERTRDIVECQGGTVARLLTRDGKPLTPDEENAERQRLHDLAASPDDFAHHTRGDANDKKLAADLIRMMPDAMIYTPVTASAPDTPDLPHAIVFDFAPNPNWTPPTTTSEALLGLRGRIWIDTRTGYVLRLQGEVFRPVNFGWGMVAHIYPGGRLLLTQTNAVDQRWIFLHFEQHIKVRALMLKTIEINSTIDSANYTKLPAPVDWKQAIDLLLR